MCGNLVCSTIVHQCIRSCLWVVWPLTSMRRGERSSGHCTSYSHLAHIRRSTPTERHDVLNDIPLAARLNIWKLIYASVFSFLSTHLSKRTLQKCRDSSEAAWALLGSTKSICWTMRVLYHVDKYCNTDTHITHTDSGAVYNRTTFLCQCPSNTWPFVISTSRLAGPQGSAGELGYGWRTEPSSIPSTLGPTHLTALTLSPDRVARAFVPRSNKDPWDSCSWVGSGESGQGWNCFNLNMTASLPRQ